MTLKYRNLDILGLIVIEPKVALDDRGFFLEKYKKSDFDELGLPGFVQDNYSVSKQNVVRGLHCQKPPFAQGKLVSVVSGKVWDVAVDIREDSPTFGQWAGVELSDENNLSFYIPPGFLHGFSVLSPEARFLYKCSEEYSREHESGVRFDDAHLTIDWKISGPPIISTKDLALLSFKEMEAFK